MVILKYKLLIKRFNWNSFGKYIYIYKIYIYIYIYIIMDYPLIGIYMGNKKSNTG